MCGIAGAIGSRIEPSLLTGFEQALHHRGPDDRGTWISPDGRIGLAHRRLSIVDLSPLGHQPMESVSGRYVLVYNGEIYDHAEIRAELAATGDAPAWRGHSDTETLLAAIDAWGLERALGRATGMFALALWDRASGQLSLARDRFGEKPLYYGWAAGVFAFASELDAIRGLPGFDNAVDRDALAALLSRTYVPAPWSIYRGIFKLPPATILTLSPDAASIARDTPFAVETANGATLTRYWSYKGVVEAGMAEPLTDAADAEAAVAAALSQAIARQSVADVPVGAFLSGGIDSSTVVALYAAAGGSRMRTFSIGFHEAGFDEATHAREVAQHFGTHHHEWYVTATDAMQVIPRLPDMYGEPFADSSAIPTHLVSAFARREVTVALSGDAGDELFGGYNRYLHAPRMWAAASRLPAPLRRASFGLAGAVPAAFWNGASKLAGGRSRPAFFGAKVRKTLNTIGRARALDDVFASFVDEWSHDRVPVLGVDQWARAPLDLSLAGDAPTAARMMYADSQTYLPDDILTKVDRASMAVSLETRVPFLDHHVAAVAARVPMEQKIAGGVTKKVLRRILYRHAPAALFERPKAGFALPIGEWLRGPLRDWAEDLLDPTRLHQEGYLDPAPVRARWAQHLAGTIDATQSVWAILMFQAWLRRERGAGAASPRPS